jgi:uncharacterized protein (TIGR00251 family)
MLEPTTRLRLRVSPGARRAGIVGRYGESWKVRVTAPPERGLANEAVLRLLSAKLQLPLSGLSVVSGLTGRDKVVELRGIDQAEAVRRLAERG